jgi:hypothetical protein
MTSIRRNYKLRKLIVIIIAVLIFSAISIHKVYQEITFRKYKQIEEETSRKRVEDEQKAKNEFQNNIAKHYNELNKLIINNSIVEAVALLDKFNEYDHLDYRDIQIIYPKIKTKYNLLKLHDIPEYNPKDRLEVYNELAALNPQNTEYPSKIKYYQRIIDTGTSISGNGFPKKDETHDMRPNDLEELCKDYLFYRNKILKANKVGDREAVKKSRASFDQINRWINEYNEKDVQAMFNKLEQNNYTTH